MLVRGGPGSSDAGLATFGNIDLSSLVAMAYGIRHYQLVAPDWMSTARFNITARVPQGATLDQYRLMLQDLLTRRFGMTLHWDKKELQVLELVVGKNGPKMKESAINPASIADDGLQPPARRAGPPPGYHGPVNMAVNGLSMERLAALLSGLVDQPVEDGTELKGDYDIQFRALVGSNPPAADAVDSPRGIIDAVQEQLGLKLVPKKGLVDVVIVDRTEKVPTVN